jgi:hypothetical protein
MIKCAHNGTLEDKEDYDAYRMKLIEWSLRAPSLKPLPTTPARILGKATKEEK